MVRKPNLCSGAVSGRGDAGHQRDGRVPFHLSLNPQEALFLPPSAADQFTLSVSTLLFLLLCVQTKGWRRKHCECSIDECVWGDLYWCWEKMESISSVREGEREKVQVNITWLAHTLVLLRWICTFLFLFSCWNALSLPLCVIWSLLLSDGWFIFQRSVFLAIVKREWFKCVVTLKAWTYGAYALKNKSIKNVSFQCNAIEQWSPILLQGIQLLLLPQPKSDTCDSA